MLYFGYRLSLGGIVLLDAKLNTFLQVVEQGSYTAAACALHLTQPAVTQHIQKLEQHYGCSLFTQRGRAIGLTEQGQRFYHYARMQQSNERQFWLQLSETATPLRIGSTLSIADYYLPPLLAPLLHQPILHLEVGNTDALLNRLLQGTLDAAFVEGMFDRGLFEAQVFQKARFLPVVGFKHPLLGRRIAPSEMHRFPLLLREPGSGTRAICENYLAQQNDSPASFAAIWEVGSFVLIKQILENTQSISFMYEAVASEGIAAGRLAYLDIEDYGVLHPLHFVHLKNSLEQKRIAAFYSSFLSA